MAKIGRNQPCPCGSGKKYKQCCLARDEAAADAAREEQRRNAPPPPPPLAPGRVPRWPFADDPDVQLAHMSNGAVDLIRAGKLDEAERLCHRLLDQFPDLPDGHMRLGQLFRARGEPTRAAQHLRLAAAVARVGVADDDDDLLALPRSLEAEADSLDPPSPQPSP